MSSCLDSRAVWCCPGQPHPRASRIWAPRPDGSKPPQFSFGDHAGFRREAGRRNLLFVVAGDIHRIELRATVLAGRIAKNMSTRLLGAQVGPSLWKPSVRMRSPDPSGRHDTDGELAAALLGEGNVLSVRRPYRRGIAAIAEADARLARARQLPSRRSAGLPPRSDSKVIWLPSGE